MQLVWLFVLIGAAVSQADGTGSYAKSCAPPIGKHPFNADRGIWYVITKHVTLPRISRNWQLSCARINCTVARTANGTKLGIIADLKEKSGVINKIEIRSKPLWSWEGLDSAASHIVWRYNSSSWGDVGQFSILSSDYDTYAITQLCIIIYEEQEGDFKRFQVTEILSRQPTMDASKLKLLKSVASTSDANEMEFEDIDNSACE